MYSIMGLQRLIDTKSSITYNTFIRLVTYKHTLEHIQVINLINVIYVVKDLVRMVAYKHTLEHIQVINLINVIYVVKDLVGMVTYKHTLEHIQVINLINVLYVIEDLVCWKLGSPDTILEGGHLRTIPPKFGCNWPCGF
jgi:hypothetical protein